ncbi:Mechanosensitive ion channel-domain-containing protein [Lipomyces japonicus]|uniref:Mechanosensitive ion channel-domain-containing protein n=1 Tax=Lipomyces japonicus TaxID=56871 RepID=UPI0034CDEAB7
MDEDFVKIHQQTNHSSAENNSGITPHGRRTGLYRRGGQLTMFGRFYQRVWNSTFVVRYIIYIIPVGLLISIPIFVGAFGNTNAGLGGVRIVWIFTWVEVVWVSLWVSKFAARVLPTVFESIIGVINYSVLKYARILTALQGPLSLVLWLFISWITLLPILTGNPDQRSANDRTTKAWESRLYRILGAFLIGSIIFAVEQFLIQMLSVNYHRKQFAGRVKIYKRHVVLLSILFEISRSIFPIFCEEFLEEDYTITAGIVGGLGKPNPKGTGMRILGNIGRVGNKISSAWGNVAQELSGKARVTQDNSKNYVTTALEHRAASGALGKRIWMSLVPEGKDQLEFADLQEVSVGLLPENLESSEFADECMIMLDKDMNGDVSLEEIINFCEYLCKERKSMTRSMHDVDNAIHVLDGVLTAVVLVAAVFVFIAVLNQNFSTMLATAASVLLSLSFVFSSTAAELLSSCVFLFVKHPYDVGDRVSVNSIDYIVDHISLLYTVFRTIDEQKNVQVPNSILNTLFVENVTRSPSMQDVITLLVNYNTSFDDLSALETILSQFLKDNDRDFYPDISLQVSGLPALDRMEIQIRFKHKSNLANEKLRLARRNKSMCALIEACRKVPLFAPLAGSPALGTAEQPQYMVTVSPDDAKQRYDSSLKAMDENRWVNNQKVPNEAASIKPKSISGLRTSGSMISRQSTRKSNIKDT